MKDFNGKGVFITGGASGIGLALARAFGSRGARVMLADIEAPALEGAVDELKMSNVDARGVICDVADREALFEAAQRAIAELGKVHVLCNNAGVGGAGGPAEEVSQKGWDWTLGINLMGVIHGVQAFTPHLRAHGEGGHIVNTASMAGMLNPGGMSSYCVTKFGVVALSENMRMEMAARGEDIAISVLCPGWVSTNIHDSQRNRPADLADAAADIPAAALARRDEIRQLIENGMPADMVAARTLEAIENDEFYIFTHPEMREAVEGRFDMIKAAFDMAEASPALNGNG